MACWRSPEEIDGVLVTCITGLRILLVTIQSRISSAVAKEEAMAELVKRLESIVTHLALSGPDESAWRNAFSNEGVDRRMLVVLMSIEETNEKVPLLCVTFFRSADWNGLHSSANLWAVSLHTWLVKASAFNG